MGHQGVDRVSARVLVVALALSSATTGVMVSSARTPDGRAGTAAGSPAAEAVAAGVVITSLASNPGPDVVRLRPRDVPQLPRPGVRPGRRVALLVGVNNARGSPPLQGAVGDATSLRSALIRFGFLPRDIVTLTNGQASRAAILREIGSLGARSRSDGQAVFLFAGHSRRNGGNRLVAADGRTISATTLAAGLGRVRGALWVALPTCYSAGYALRGTVGPNRIATFASSATQKAYESTGYKHSLLGEFLFERGLLEGLAAPTVEGAFEYARSQLERWHPNNVPLMDDQYPGDFVLAESALAPPVDTSEIREGPGAYNDPPIEDEAPPEESPPPRRCGAFILNCRSR